MNFQNIEIWDWIHPVLVMEHSNASEKFFLQQLFNHVKRHIDDARFHISFRIFLLNEL